MDTKDNKRTGQPDAEPTKAESFTVPGMSRYIYCPTCYELFAAIAPEPDCQDRYIDKAGSARYPMRCDFCNRPLMPGELAYAQSAFTDEDAYRVRHTANVEEGLRLAQGAVDMAHRTFSTTLSDFQRMASRSLGLDGLTKYVTEALAVPESLRRAGKMPRA